ncbi:MAG TPA: hypothetical protein VMF06_15835 [Candidatus Limnocylindria bacterium]|jgi:hypothetical protein|nr:hypothetical protein [Candidatus Limnocylindria bacterium]
MTRFRRHRHGFGFIRMNILYKILSLLLLSSGMVLMVCGNSSGFSHANGVLMLAGGTAAAVAGLVSTLRTWKQA